MSRLVTILALLALAVTQEYLPKEGPMPICDVFTKDIARSGINDFWKVDQNVWSLVFSALPIRPNVITEVTFYLVNGNGFGIGCGRLDKTNEGIDGVGLATDTGLKWNKNGPDAYSSPAIAGDKIKMTIDMRPMKYTLSFAKNNLDLGIAYGGLNLYRSDIYIYFGINQVGHRIKVIDYKVIE